MQEGKVTLPVLNFLTPPRVSGKTHPNDLRDTPVVRILALPPQDLALPSFSVGRERGAGTDAAVDHVIQDEPISSFCPQPQRAPMPQAPVRSHDLTRLSLRTFEDTFFAVVSGHG